MTFSIIIPCYNIEKYIEKTVFSVLNQTFEDFELILIDDGSTDNTLEKIELLSQKDKRIKIYHHNNKGVSYTRNRGISLSKGEYIFFLDGDDLITKDLLEKADLVFRNTSISMFSFGYKTTFSSKKETIHTSKKDNGKIFSSKEFLKKFLNYNLYQCICSFIVKKELILHKKFDENLISGEDSDFQMRLFLSENFFVLYSSDILFKYIKRENSATTGRINIKILNVLSSLSYLRKDMLEKNIYEFKKYHIIRFFGLISGISKYGYNEKDYKEFSLKFKEHSNVLEELNFSFNKSSLVLWILKLLYKINLKILIYFFKIMYLFKERV